MDFELTDSIRCRPEPTSLLPALAFSLLFRFQGAGARRGGLRSGHSATREWLLVPLLRGLRPVRSEMQRYRIPERASTSRREISYDKVPLPLPKQQETTAEQV